jgi:hypothetical protein
MVEVSTVRMIVLDRFVPVRMAVLPDHGWIVRMRVMTVVVAVCVIVLECTVEVPMMVGLGDV